MASARSSLFPSPITIPTTHWDDGQYPGYAADIFAACGTPVLAPFDGEARPLNFNAGGYTNRVIADDGTTVYLAHLADGGRVSGRVSAGQVVGYVSDSGNAKAAGCHLHLAVNSTPSITNQGKGDIRPVDFFNGAPVLPEPATSPAVPASEPAKMLGLGLGALALIGFVVWSVADEF